MIVQSSMACEPELVVLRRRESGNWGAREEREVTYILYE
jgi:hypothetical protein